MKKLILIPILLFVNLLYGQQQVTICGEENTIFTYQTSSMQGVYTWALNNNVIGSNSSSIIIDWREYGVGSYQLEVNFTDINGCVADPITYDILINICLEFNIFIPTAFSPNDDVINEFFTVKGYGFDVNSFSMKIYDRWGLQLYYTTDINKPWSGRNEITNAEYPQGIYVYKVNITDDYGIQREYLGRVMIVK